MSRSWWDLIDDARTGRIQASKVWVHVGNAAATAVLFCKVVKEPGSVDANFLLVYMGCIIGGYGFMYTASARRQHASDNGIPAGEDSSTAVAGAADILGGDSLGNAASVPPGGVSAERGPAAKRGSRAGGKPGGGGQGGQGRRKKPR